MALNFKITYSTLAEDGLNDIRDYVFFRSKDLETANRVFGRIVKFIGNLTFNPFMGRILSEYKLKTEDVRRITAEKRYNIYYRVDEQARQIYILKIVDGRQSVKHQLLGL